MVVSGLLFVSCVMPSARDFYCFWVVMFRFSGFSVWFLRYVFCYVVPLGQGVGSSLFGCQLPRCGMIRLCALSGPFVPTGFDSGKRELVEQLEVSLSGGPLWGSKRGRV